MCGIAGFTHLNRAAARGIAHRINETISHRGPDQQGVFEGSVATLCAVRLKIIDLAGRKKLPVFSSSSLRYAPELVEYLADAKHGKVLTSKM